MANKGSLFEKIKKHINERNKTYVDNMLFGNTIENKLGTDTPEETAKMWDEFYSNMKNPRIHTKSDDIFSILEDGFYKSAKSTKHTSAPENHVNMAPGSKRRVLSEDMFGYSPRTSGDEIYGMIGRSGESNGDEYGSYILNLKPSSLERATILPDDSYELVSPHPIVYGERDPAFFIQMPKSGTGFPRDRVKAGRRGSTEGLYNEIQFHYGKDGIPLSEVESLEVPNMLRIGYFPQRFKDASDKYGFSIVDKDGCFYNCKE